MQTAAFAARDPIKRLPSDIDEAPGKAPPGGVPGKTAGGEWALDAAI
jgi:hypothetical protein